MGDPTSLAVFIDPVSRHFERDGLFDVRNPKLNRDEALAPYAYLKDWLVARGVAVHTADHLVSGDVARPVNVFVSMGMTDRVHRVATRPDVVMSAFFALECPIVDPASYRQLHALQRYFKRIFSYSDEASLAPFVRGRVRLHKYWIPYAWDAVRGDLWRRHERRFLTIINTNKRPALYVNELYTERLRAIEFFSRTGEIDLYGMGWDGPPYQMGSTWVPATIRRTQRTIQGWWQRYRPDPRLEAARRAYKGPLESKLEILSQYAFAICFENMVLTGWITEKIFDCFVAGTVPIYLGAPDIIEHVPAECFIDMRRFAGYADLARYLKSLDARAVQGYRDRARHYLESPQFHRFTKHAFVELFAGMVEDDTGIPLKEAAVRRSTPLPARSSVV